MHPKCVCSAPDPTGGAYSTPPDPVAVFEGPLHGREGEGEGREVNTTSAPSATTLS